MKTKRVVAALVGTALVATTAFSLAGCGEKKAKLNISDYAIEYTKNHKINEGYTQLAKLTNYKRGSNFGNGLILIYDDAAPAADYDYVYSVYSTLYEKSLASTLKIRPESFTFGNFGTGVKTYLEDGTCSVYAPDGTVVMTNVKSVSSYVQRISGYVSGAEKLSDILVLSGTENTEQGKEVKKYVEVKVNEINNLYSYSLINVSDIKFYSSEFNKGEYLTGLSDKIYESTDDKPVDSDLCDYSASIIGNTITFYKNNNKTGSVDITNARGVGYAGTNFYYSVEIPVDSNEKSKYNYTEFSDDGVQTRYNCTLYKYDIAKNKNTEVKYDGRVQFVLPYYNYTNKTYDAAVVVGNKNVNGVAYSDLSEFAYITDNNLTLAYDITDILIDSGISGSASALYKLDDSNYLLGGYIVDSNLNVVSKAGVVYGEGLVSFSNNGYYGLKDLSGKIVAEPRYSRPEFYGGNALVDELQSDGTTKKVLLSADGSAKEVVLADNETLEAFNGYYIVDKYSAGSLTVSGKHTYTVYNFAGNAIKTFADSDTAVYSLNASGNLLTVLTSRIGEIDNDTTLYKFI